MLQEKTPGEIRAGRAAFDDIAAESRYHALSRVYSTAKAKKGHGLIDSAIEDDASKKPAGAPQGVLQLTYFMRGFPGKVAPPIIPRMPQFMSQQACVAWSVMNLPKSMRRRQVAGESYKPS